MNGDEPQRKKALRAELRARRRTLTASERDTATVAFTQHLTELVNALGATTIAAFLPSNDEPDIRPFLDWASDTGIHTLTPVSREDGLLDWVADSGDETVGDLGVPEPVGDLLGPMAVDDVDLMLIPAAAVDRAGMRLGWGRGYFDRLIGSMEDPPPIYAVIFETELLEA
ncbi:MAG TPA: 5-formyltetrahydrofolate cyclo-ligase, partial [Terrimesophilobacter sp.]|nr:5-formyltetrahydrofolate cyclo-ligase [Terrimesophilobacter sp.]